MARKDDYLHTGWHDIWGIVLLAFGAFFLLALLSYDPGDISVLQSPPRSPPANLIGPVGAWLSFLGIMLFGVCVYLAALALGVHGCIMLFRRTQRSWPKALWLLAVVLAFMGLTEAQADLWAAPMRGLNIANPGGLLGLVLIRGVFIRLLGVAGTVIVAITILLVSLFFLFEIESLSFMAQAGAALRAIPGWIAGLWRRRGERADGLEQEAVELERKRKQLEKALRAKEREERKRTSALKPVAEPPKPADAAAAEEEPPKKRRAAKVMAEKQDDVAAFVPDQGEAPHMPYKLPPLAMLDPVPNTQGRQITNDTAASAKVLEATLSEFGIEAEVTHAEVGPVVTSFEVLPAPGVRVERIAGLANNIALNMKAVSVRVQAPIPGKGVVGIEVPNQHATMVFLRELLEGRAFKKGGAALPLVLGKDVAGQDIVADLAKMPHMLIAGATGSGKSVCMNSLLAGLLMSRTPEQLKLMLVDPKMVEFSFFNELPHLVVPVITDPKKVSLGLRWAINEMEKRYKLFARVGVRNIQSYNQRPILQQEELFDPAELGEGEEPPPPPKKDPDRLPYIVIVIDELADLMMVAQADIENAIARLAQLSRAVGIHMIIATQRPSVNVITGTIKANFPARVAFQVAQKVDSRTILDGNGADTLLGKGDMLFLPPGTSKLVRAQGAMTTDREIHEIVEFWKRQGEPDYEVAIKEKIEGRAVDLPEQDDDRDNELVEQAVEVIRQTKRATTSSLQRRLRIGYTRAARLMDVLEERGIVGPPNGSDPRDILIDLDGEIPEHDAGEEE